MYFLLAIGIWIYIITIINNDKRNHKKVSEQTQKWFDDAKLEFDTFLKKYVADDSLVDFIEHEVYTDSDVAKNMKERIYKETSIKATDDMTIRALLAKDCKVLRKTAYGGIRTNINGKKEMERERRFIVWYDNELRSCGFPYPILFVPWNQKVNLKSGDDSASLTLIECTDVTSGIYFWSPIKAFATGLDSIVT